MSRFRATPDHANFLLAAASKLGTDISAVRIVDGYLTATDDIVTEAYEQGLPREANLDPDHDPENDRTAADSLAEGRAGLEEENRVRAEAEAAAKAKADAEQAKFDEAMQAEAVKTATRTTRTAKKAAAKKTAAPTSTQE